MKTFIFGKKSYLSVELQKKIKNSRSFSLSDKRIKNINFTNSNIIINSFYSSLKLEKIKNYENFINKSIFEISKLLDLLNKQEINHIIYTSSSSIYNSINEDDFTDERNRKLYASTKYNVENLIKNFCYKNNIKLSITRIFNIFGDKEKFSIISKIINSYKSKIIKLNLINNGESIRDFIHIDDVVECYKKILKNKIFGIVDVGSGYGVKIIDLINAIGKKNFKIKYLKKNETNYSIAQDLKFKTNKFKSLEKFLKIRLELKNDINFEKIISTKKNYIQDYVPGSIIYGAGKTGKKLLKIHKETKNNHISYFVDDNPKVIAKKTIEGIKVLSFNELFSLSKYKTINNIIIAIPSISSEKLNNLLKKLSPISLNVSYFDLDFFGEKNYLSLPDLSDKLISDIFKRKTKTHYKFIKKIYNKTILITGAGGSIGSELVKQSLICGAKVIGLDHSELGLYNLENELKTHFEKNKFKLVLGSINDRQKLEKLRKDYNIEVVFHAAAYKHVNILEKNVSLAIKNNLFGTKNILEIFNDKKIEIVIISTDKAARPKSILGATKRLAEIVSQNYSISNKFRSKIKIVRFGNVFGSQGSAIELFIHQLNKNLPITITNLKAKRFFMSIREACNLVLNVTELNGSDMIYILNMGKQILVKDIIYKLAEIKNINTKNIILKEIGLKKGEKLSEELSINKKFKKTFNKEIFLVKEPTYNHSIVENILKRLEFEMKNFDEKKLRNTIFNFLKKEQ